MHRVSWTESTKVMHTFETALKHRNSDSVSHPLEMLKTPFPSDATPRGVHTMVYIVKYAAVGFDTILVISSASNNATSQCL